MSCQTLLQGERVRLRPLEERDLPYLCRWEQDPVVDKFWGSKFQHSPRPEMWLADLQGSSHRRGFAIETKAGLLIGDLQLEDIDHRQGTAELRICIGHDGFRGQGMGTEAVSLAAEYAFSQLDLRALYVRVDLANWQAIRCYHKCGFVAEGILARPGRRGRTMALMVLKRGGDGPVVL